MSKVPPGTSPGQPVGLATTVVNKARGEAYDVYIGRPSKWGNPYVIGPHGSREEVIAKCRAWIANRPHLLADLPSLRGKRLGCFCSPLPCHGDVLAEMADHYAPLTSTPGAPND
jgi:hypothetical protein